MSFKDNLRDEMSYQGITLKELSARTGISYGSLSNYLKEAASVPSADVAVKISRALNVSVEYLVTRQNHKLEKSDSLHTLPAKIRRLTDSIRKLNDRDFAIVETLIEKMSEE